MGSSIHMIWLIGSFVIALLTSISFLPSRKWYITCWKYGYRVLLVLHAVSVLSWYWIESPIRYFSTSLVLINLFLLGIILQKIYPYLSIARTEMQDSAPGAGHFESISFLFANVLQTNDRYEDFYRIVEELKPDVILAVETDETWTNKILDYSRYKYAHSCPLDNMYGMTIVSLLPLVSIKTRYLIQDDIPSFHARIRTRGGKHFRFYGIHPRPPSPVEYENAVPKDQEMIKLGKIISNLEGDHPCVVGGDLNDVCWSRTTELFQSLSGLLDPRKGRGFYATFPSNVPLFNIPIDQVFCSPHFTLTKLKVGPDFGSDHLPLYVEVELNSSEVPGNDKPESDESDEKEAREILDLDPEAE